MTAYRATPIVNVLHEAIIGLYLPLINGSNAESAAFRPQDWRQDRYCQVFPRSARDEGEGEVSLPSITIFIVCQYMYSLIVHSGTHTQILRHEEFTEGCKAACNGYAAV